MEDKTRNRLIGAGVTAGVVLTALWHKTKLQREKTRVVREDRAKRDQEARDQNQKTG